ncbi:MAG: PKD domain-containing protein, partial [bacterium]|nr:PKD domain-containing protein [bacterium]
MYYKSLSTLKLIVGGIVFIAMFNLGGETIFAQSKNDDGAVVQQVLARTLNIVINPSGAGTVSKNPNKSTYDQNELVRLQANASGQYSFLHWSGDIDRRTGNPTYIYMEEDRTIAANFVIQNSNKISTPNEPDGPTSSNTGKWLTFESGGATSSIGGQVEYIFDWGNGYISEWGSATRSIAYGKAGTYKIRVRARSTNDPYTVSSWSAEHSVSVSGPDKHILSILINPEGAGRVNIDPDKEGYDDGDLVQLRAIANSGYQFQRWTEGMQVKSTSNPFNIYMLKDRTIIANFTGGSGGDETVSTPDRPTGPSTGNVGENLSYTTGGAVSNLGHEVEYQFDWGDGTTSGWGSASRSYSYGSAGTYQVKARARCQTHTSIVSGWSSSREVTISGTSETYTLTILVNPEGAGSVNINPNKASYTFNESVQLTATANSGYTFENWTGDISTNSNNPITIYMQRDRVITANFTDGGGGETVSIPDTPAGPDNGAIGQNLQYTTGGSVSNLGHEVEYQFDWGDGNTSAWGNSSQSYSYGSAGTYQVKARARCQTHTSIVSGWSSSREVTISGTSETYTLTILVNPEGAGSVNINPNKASYTFNESVQLTATANSGYTFENWTGDISTNSNNPITIYMQRDRVITANFTDGGGGETVSIPDTPAGPDNGAIGQNLQYTTGGSVSNLGHEVEYQFDWGDGNNSNWGSEFQSYSYQNIGNYQIRARARCVQHTDIVSGWSEPKNVTVSADASGYVLTIISNPEFGGTVLKNPDKGGYDPDEMVELTAIANPNFRFDHWSGDITTNTNNPITIYMRRDRTIIANFIFEGVVTVTIPNRPDGPTNGEINQTLNFATGGSVCNAGHPVEYQFDWGYDQQSAWGDSLQSHSYETAGEYSLKARARSVTDTLIVSDWSQTFDVSISDLTGYYNLSITITPENSGIVNVNPQKSNYRQDEVVQLFAFPKDSGWQQDSGNLHVEADSGQLDGNFYVAPDSSASSGYYIFGNQGLSRDGSVSCTFEIEQPGDYYVWGRCMAFSDAEDSFFFIMGDDGDTLTWHLDSIYGLWMWQRVSHQFQPQVFSLDVGQHMIKVIKRDLNARLDKLILTQNIDFIPQGKAELPHDDVNYYFDHWTGDLSGNTNPVLLTMSGDKSVTAHFSSEMLEIVSPPTDISGPDSGYVGHSLHFQANGAVSNFGNEVSYQFDWGDGNQSDWGSNIRSHIYLETNTYQVRARARSQSDTTVVSEWAGDHTVVVFEPAVVSYQLGIAINPPGTGTVLKSPDQSEYAHGDTVHILALPNEGYLFSAWSGDVSGSENPVTIIMNSNKMVMAVFVQATEQVSPPTKPVGPDSGVIGQSLSFIT